MFVQRLLRRFRVEATAVPPGDLAQIEAAIWGGAPHPPDARGRRAPHQSLSPQGPLSLEGLVAVARRHGLRTVIDSTFATGASIPDRWTTVASALTWGRS